MISPSPGRILWYFPPIGQRDPNGQPLAAILAKVLSDRCVNLTVSHGDGTTYAAQNVQLLQDDDQAPETAYAFWMPYQKGQAAKTEQAIAGSATSAPPINVASVTAAVDELTQETRGKFQQFGNWLQMHVGGLMNRVAVLEGKPLEMVLPHPEDNPSV